MPLINPQQSQNIGDASVEMFPVRSSHIRLVGWNNLGMVVEFHNNERYGYIGVPQQIFQGMLKATSKGKYLQHYVKRFYRHKKI